MAFPSSATLVSGGVAPALAGITIGVYPSTNLSVTEVQRATAAGAASSLWQTVWNVEASSAYEVSFTDRMPLSTRSFFYKARHKRVGFSNSGFTNIVSGKPIALGDITQSKPVSGAATALIAFGRSTPANAVGSFLPIVVSGAGGTFFTYTSGGDTNGFMWIAWAWTAQTFLRPDGSTITVAAASTQLTAPAAPTVSSVAGGALGARTRKVRVGFVKNKTAMNVSGESSIAVPANSLLKVTAPTDPGLGYDGWFPMVGAVANTEWTQPTVDPFNPIAFGTDWTEPAGGSAVVAGTGTLFDAAQVGAMTSMGLNQSSAYKFYPYWDVAGAKIIPQQAVTAADTAKAQIQHADGHIAPADVAIAGSTPAAGGGGSGGDGGGRYL